VIHWHVAATLSGPLHRGHPVGFDAQLHRYIFSLLRATPLVQHHLETPFLAQTTETDPIGYGVLSRVT
jgi:hypothetical protein